jgi:pyruvate/2-oxoglutarate/acetoin dehydrogenase E1 component
MKTTYRSAVHDAIGDAMRADERVVLLGEDVGRYGGTYAVSKGMLEEFGAERIRDTPISELGFVGIGIGAALGGLRPIVEVMTVNFSLLALDQIVNTAAALRHMSSGQFSIPVVVRMATGAGRQLAAQHSHSLENWYAHVPGITVLAPATVADAYGMLRTALTSPDPVIIAEHVGLYNLAADVEELIPTEISRAALRRNGTDATIIAYGGSWRRWVGRTAWWWSTRHGTPAAWPARSAPASWSRRSTNSTPRSPGCAPPRCRSPTPNTSRKPPCPSPTRSSRRCGGCSGSTLDRVSDARPRRGYG